MHEGAEPDCADARSSGGAGSPSKEGQIDVLGLSNLQHLQWKCFWTDYSFSLPVISDEGDRVE